MANVQYDIELNTRLDKIDSGLSGVEKKLDSRFKNAGANTGSAFGSTFARIAGSLIGAVSFAGLLKGAFNAIAATRQATTANLVLAGSIDAANQKSKDNNAILRSSTSSIEQKALAIGFDTDKIYENVKASAGAKTSTQALERQIRQAENAYEDQSKAIEQNIRALDDKKNKEVQSIRQAQGYNTLTEEQQKLEKELTDLEVIRLQAIKSGDATAYALALQQIQAKKLDQDLTDAKIKQIDLQTNKVESLYEVQIKGLRAELDASKNKFDIDIEPARRKLDELQAQVSGGGGSSQVLSKSFKEALQKSLENGVKTIDKTQVNKEIDNLFADLGKKTGLAKDTFTGAFSNLFQAGLTDVEEVKKTVEGFVKIASKGSLPLADGVAQLAEQFRNENAALGERAGLTDEYASQIGPRGLAILQAEGKLRGKNFDELSNEERALSKAAGLRINVADAQGVFNAKLEAGAFEMDKQKVKLQEVEKAIGAGLTPAFTELVKATGPVLDFFLNFFTNNQDLTPVIFGLTAGVIALATAFSLLGGPVTLVIGAVILSIALLKHAYDENVGGIQDKLKEFVKFFQEEILPHIQPIIDEFIELIKNISPILKPFIETFFTFFGEQIENFLVIFKGITKVVRGVLEVINGLFSGDGQKISDGFSRIFSGFGDIVKGAFNTVIDNVNLAMKSFNELGNSFEKLTGGKINVADIPPVPKLANGGSIIPPGYNNDTFPLFGPGGRLMAMAQSGERIDVVPRNEVSQTDNRQINSGNTTQFIYQEQYKEPNFSNLAYNY